MKKQFYALAVTLFCVHCSPALADLLYKPINPSFGGDSFNSNHLQSMATTQNQFKEDGKTTSKQTNGERFVSMLQSRLYSSLAAQVADSIFGDNAQQTGTLRFDDQEIFFFNTGTEIRLTITDHATGNVTNITLPTVN